MPILFVEDDDNDVIFLQRALRQAAVHNPAQFVTDGQQAVEYLTGTGRFEDRQAFPLPGLMITDFKLPYRTGPELIQWMRADLRFRRIPVIVLSSTASPIDIAQVYEAGGNSFLVKPSATQELAVIFTALKHYWLLLNRFT